VNMNINFSYSAVLIIGDVMLDKYHFGKVQRISPEAPVPVVRVKESTYRLGGAANVANNIAHLQGKSSLVGLVGKDDNQKILSDLLDKINVSAHLIETDMPTTTKIRVIGEHQQIVRLDFEEITGQQPEIEAKIVSLIDMLADGVKAVVISDYGKGSCTKRVCEHVIKRANQKGIPVIIDPKGNDWSKYRGATLITPNVKELGEVVGVEIPNEDQEIEKYGLKILREIELNHLLVTRSEKGMTLISHDGLLHVHTEAREVFDVSGAGDTVVATMAAAIANGIDVKAAVNLANKAAGIVVGKSGTAPIEYDELTDLIKNGTNKKLISLSVLLKIVKKVKDQGKKIVLTSGHFNDINSRHITYLKEARRQGNVLVVGLKGDGSSGRLEESERLLNTQEDRAEVLAALESVDYICIFEEDEPFNLIHTIGPDILAMGDF